MLFELYLLGGVIIFIGNYGYIKTKDSIGMRPTGFAEKLYSFNGFIGSLVAIPYLIGMGVLFEWWYPIVFMIVNGFFTAFVFLKTGGLLPLFLAVYGTPIGYALVVYSMAKKIG